MLHNNGLSTIRELRKKLRIQKQAKFLNLAFSAACAKRLKVPKSNIKFVGVASQDITALKNVKWLTGKVDTISNAKSCKRK